MSHKESSVNANMVKIEGNFSDSNEIEIGFKSIQSDIKQENEEETLLNIKHEELDIKDELPSTSTFQSNGNQDFDGSVPSISCQKSNQKHERIDDDFKSIGRNIKLETEDDILLDIKQEEIDIKDEVPSTSTLHSDGHQDFDDSESSVSFQKSNQIFATSHEVLQEKLFVCKVCDYKCAHTHNLTSHMKSHTGEKSFACGLCDFKSAHKSRLTSHIKTHTREKSFACAVCDYKCEWKKSLSSHMKRHTGEKPFACGLCDFKCAHKNSLTLHMISHTGKLPFACSLCDYKCAQKNRLTSHMKTHTREKSFPCALCDFKSAWKGNLTVHMRSHTEEKLN